MEAIAALMLSMLDICCTYMIQSQDPSFDCKALQPALTNPCPTLRVPLLHMLHRHSAGVACWVHELGPLQLAKPCPYRP